MDPSKQLNEGTPSERTNARGNVHGRAHEPEPMRSDADGVQPPATKVHAGGSGVVGEQFQGLYGLDSTHNVRVGGEKTLAHLAELAGDLRCVRCTYNLRGLSIMSVCPECGAPVRATLLYVVDPDADELKPLIKPKWLSIAIVMWPAGALLAAACVWSLRASDFADGSVSAGRLELLRILMVFFFVVSGVGASGLIKPHEEIGRVQRRIAGLAVLGYVPLIAAMYWLHGMYDPARQPPYASMRQVDQDRVISRLVIGMIALAIVLGLRHNARLIAQRSVLLRTGRSNRQILLGLAAAIVLTMVGDVANAVAITTNEPSGGPIAMAGLGIIVAGSALMTFGIASACIDTLRLRRVILDPPLTLRQIIRDPVGGLGAGLGLGREGETGGGSDDCIRM